MHLFTTGGAAIISFDVLAWLLCLVISYEIPKTGHDNQMYVFSAATNLLWHFTRFGTDDLQTNPPENYQTDFIIIPFFHWSIDMKLAVSAYSMPLR